MVISGKSADKSTSTQQRLCGSFAEDICSATTRGRRSVPKHQLLALTLHHLTGKAEVVTLLHRYGHCTSYTGVLELETALATQVLQEDSIVPANISTTEKKVIHLCWDNFDLNEETPSGSGTTHTTHGIAIQETVGENNAEKVSKSLVKSRKRGLQVPPSTPLPCVTQKNAEPSLQLRKNCDGESTGNVNSTKDTHSREQLWILCRGQYNSKFTVPDWSGWLSMTSEEGVTEKTMLSRIGYMSPIMLPITEFATVKKCLDLSLAVSEKVQQEYTLVTMDLAAAWIAYDIIWSNGSVYEKVLLNIGPFHTMCSYMGSLGKMMCDSGFEDIIIEAGLCASGSIQQVMSGKHYNRAMRVHQRMMEALERMLQMSLINNTQDVDNEQLLSLATLANEPSAINFQTVEGCDSSEQYLTNLEENKNCIRDGKNRKTAQFWLKYCDCVWLLLRFQRSVKENQLSLFRKKPAQFVQNHIEKHVQFVVQCRPPSIREISASVLRSTVQH